MSIPNDFYKTFVGTNSTYLFSLHTNDGNTFKPIASRFDWVEGSSDANQAELATRLLFENPVHSTAVPRRKVYSR